MLGPDDWRIQETRERVAAKLNERDQLLIWHPSALIRLASEGRRLSQAELNERMLEIERVAADKYMQAARLWNDVVALLQRSGAGGLNRRPSANGDGNVH
ncbi:MAG: hypothetical protein GEU73_17470 [Chloroflexi bacterium]|nr:hypothetical protein [Chloroflexota bacterium]